MSKQSGTDVQTEEIPNQRPTKFLTKNQLTEIADHKFNIRKEAMQDEFVIRSNDQWKAIRDYWSNSNDEEKRDAIFGLVYFNGAKERDITRLFNIPLEQLKPYRDVIQQAAVLLKLKIQGHQIKTAFLNDIPALKFFLGKQFAEQVENPAHEGVESVSSAPTVVFKETKAEFSEERAELEAAVKAAEAKGRRYIQ